MRNYSPFIILFGFLFFCLSCKQEQKPHNLSHSFELGDSVFLLDGRPFQMISGEMHYTRIPPEYWRDRMRMARAMGLNTIGTYVFWNAHEPTPGKYDFTGNNDIAAFINAAKEEGLFVVLRPSPYVCAEWEFGGYPWWLLKDSSVKVRSKDERFISAYRNYINELSKHLVPLLVNHGGNILMVQLENEYGSYSDDKSYLSLNEKLFRDAGFDCTLFTCDGADKMSNGYLPGYLPAVNGLEDTAQIKKVVNEHHNGKGPYYLAEWYPGWFDQWGNQHANTSADKNAETLNRILNAGISINMYMFHGGTTRGFMNGANMNMKDPYAPQTSSYDYDAPLDEAGNPTAKYLKFREVISRHLPEGDSLPPIPAGKKSMSFGSIHLTEMVSMFDHLPKPVEASSPRSFEELDQPYGYVLYRSVIKNTGSGWLKLNGLRDYAIIYINGQTIGVLDRRLNTDSILLKNIASNDTLDIWVENNGRINYGPYLTDNRKGILGNVSFKNAIVHDWKMYGFPLNDLKSLEFVNIEKKNKQQPTCYKGKFQLTDTADTYLDLHDFGKGFVILNGHHLGKYWNIGPQQTLYVPACWLRKGDNEIIVFDELRYDHSVLPTLSNPILNQTLKLKK